MQRKSLIGGEKEKLDYGQNTSSSWPQVTEANHTSKENKPRHRRQVMAQTKQEKNNAHLKLAVFFLVEVRVAARRGQRVQSASTRNDMVIECARQARTEAEQNE